MSKKYNNDSTLSPKIWRNLVTFWTIILYVVVVCDFFMRNTLKDLLTPLCTIYIALLAIYTAQKEFERWHDNNVGRHPGEIYIIVWTILVLIFFCLQFYYHGTYQLPSDVTTTYFVVLGILAITRKSKSNYLFKKKK